jgi:hypothetical protein
MWWTNHCRNKCRVLIRYAGLVLLAGIIHFALWHNQAWATYGFTIAVTPNTAVALTMGDPMAGTILSYDIVNTGTSGNLYQMIFTVPVGYVLTTAVLPGDAPTGWTTATLSNGNRTITFSTNRRGAYTIPRNSTPRTFKLRLGTANVPTLALDTQVTLATVQARYTDRTYQTYNNPGNSAWWDRSLALLGFTAVDSLTGLQSSSPGRSLTVTLQVANRSLTQRTITAVPQPPTAAIVWASGNTTITTVSNPNVTLPAGQTGTLVWVYAIGSNCGVATPPTGSVSFGITSITGGASASSKTYPVATPYSSNIVAIGCFTGTIGLAPSCLASGTNLTITMTLTNGYASNITGVTAAIVLGGTATKTWISGPTYSNTTITAGANITVRWVYRITGTAGQTFSFNAGVVQGNLVGPPPTPGLSASVTPSPVGSIITPPVITPAPATIPSDKNQMIAITWSFTDTLCNPVNQVAITVPAGGWQVSTALDGSPDASALITDAFDDWNVNQAGSTITFAAGTIMATTPGNGKFTIIFSTVPSAQGNYIFPVAVTEAGTGNVTNVNTTVLIDVPAGSGIQPAGLWGEQIN